jgi:hypothetical protein
LLWITSSTHFEYLSSSGMTKLLDKFIVSILISVMTAFTSSPSIYAANKVVTPPATECFIKIDDPHFSEYLLRTRGITAIKINASSKCNKPMSNLMLTVEIYKTGYFFDYRVAKEEFKRRVLIPPFQVIKNQQTYVQCLNRKKTEYYGKAYAVATIDEKIRKTLTVFTAKTFYFECGT